MELPSHLFLAFSFPLQNLQGKLRYDVASPFITLGEVISNCAPFSSNPFASSRAIHVRFNHSRCCFFNQKKHKQQPTKKNNQRHKKNKKNPKH